MLDADVIPMILSTSLYSSEVVLALLSLIFTRIVEVSTLLFGSINL